MLKSALSIGISEDRFWHMSPRKLNIYVDAYKAQAKIRDRDMWQMGIYIESAVATAVEHCLSGRKARSKYIEKPLSQIQEEHTFDDGSNLPEAEKERLRQQLVNKLNGIGLAMERVGRGNSHG